MPLTPRDRLIVALDVPDPEAAFALVDALAGTVGMFKVGSQLYTAAGPDLVRALVRRGEKVFLDLKYHDIPNTVGGAVGEASRLGVSLMTVHTLGGLAMMQAAVGALPAMGTRLLGVTVLTSHDGNSLEQVGLSPDVLAGVRRLALLARDAELDGIVCAPGEIAVVREVCGPDFMVVTPGIRPTGAEAGDQARPATPAAALAAGANLIVVGRPIIAAPDPRAAAEAIVSEIAAAVPPSS